MSAASHSTRRRVMTALAGVALFPGFSAAQPAPWVITGGDLRIVCPLTVGGSFEGRSSALSGALIPGPGTPTTFTGEIHFDLQTIDTGIELRNRHLRENYLEVARGKGFETAVLSDLVLPDTRPSSPDGKTRFTAQLLVHGVRKPVSGTAELRISGNSARVEARFPLRIPDHEIAPPRYLGVGVRDEIQILVSLMLEAKELQK